MGKNVEMEVDDDWNCVARGQEVCEKLENGKCGYWTMMGASVGSRTARSDGLLGAVAVNYFVVMVTRLAQRKSVYDRTMK